MSSDTKTKTNGKSTTKRKATKRKLKPAESSPESSEADEDSDSDWSEEERKKRTARKKSKPTVRSEIKSPTLKPISMSEETIKTVAIESEKIEKEQVSMSMQGTTDTSVNHSWLDSVIHTNVHTLGMEHLSKATHLAEHMMKITTTTTSSTPSVSNGVNVDLFPNADNVFLQTACEYVSQIENMIHHWQHGIIKGKEMITVLSLHNQVQFLEDGIRLPIQKMCLSLLQNWIQHPTFKSQLDYEKQTIVLELLNTREP